MCALLGACRKREIDPVRRAEAQQAYGAVCSRCHGADGSSGIPVAGVAPPNFRDVAFQRSRTDAEIAQVIEDGKA